MIWWCVDCGRERDLFAPGCPCGAVTAMTTPEKHLFTDAAARGVAESWQAARGDLGLSVFTTADTPPRGQNLVRTVLEHLAADPPLYPGVGGTCYQCPFATQPLDPRGRLADWRDIANDPTEAYFRCSLPGRDNEAVVWGEDAPCTEREWAQAALEALDG